MHNGFASFYRGKKVLVTGHTGFKGGWLASWLKLLGAEVTGFARPPATEPNLFTAASVDIGMQSVIGEIQDLTQVRDLFNRVQPEIVIHNAAQAIVRRSYRDPVETYATNVMGTVHILAAAQQTLSVRAVVIVTSDKCYENQERVDGYREEDPMGGHDPYSSSKGAAELITAAYRRSFFSGQGSAAIASVRAGNVIGGGDWSEDRLIPDIARAISSDTPIIIRSPGSIRPWQHVLEPLRGYLLVAERLWREGRKYAEAWNFGPRQEDAVTVSEVARRVISKWGSGKLEIRPDPTGPHEAKYLQLNCGKSARLLGWRPELRLEQALDWTVEWYRSYYERSLPAREVTQHQIQSYMEASKL
jgi:CDP-glucose 4,6-dehydratase